MCRSDKRYHQESKNLVYYQTSTDTDMYFSTFEQKCKLCQRWQCHEVISSKTDLNLLNHSTCICNLINYGGVCCVFGYKTLLSDEKELITYLGEPKGSNLYINLTTISPCIASDNEIELVNKCKTERIKLLQVKME